MAEASEIMKKAISALSLCSAEKKQFTDKEFDINGTGLIGLENSPITTTLGSLEAKRTTTNPNMGALIVDLLYKAGVREGDAVAVGASGSFPALIVAVMSAAKAMGVKPIIICSLGASQWGANRPEFHVLKMLECLSSSGVYSFLPAALSLGGERDAGKEMPAEARELLIRDVEDSGILFVQEEDLQTNVRTKMQVYEKNAGENGIKGFINIGGSWSNIGTSSKILDLKPGLVKTGKIPPVESRGLVFEMIYRKIPVVHLLYIKGLIESYGLPWDPSPLPDVGKGLVYRKAVQESPLFLLIAVAYLCLMLVLFFVFFRFWRERQ
ncbi:MAG: poly-gamma-glutamate system protein, partial [Candidatus Aminicenantes bacterium]|nr:poly-gamma-glutamate system protein [Candidatus Aminicenantes bacterium]